MATEYSLGLGDGDLQEACSSPGHLLSAEGTVRKWVSGLKLARDVAGCLLPGWSLVLVLAVLKRQPLEPIKLASLKHLMWKTVFLLAFTSVRRVSELHALCYRVPYLAMLVTGVVLYPKVDCLPMVASQFHVTQPSEVPARHGEEEPGLCLLCVRRARKFYFLRTVSF